METGVECPCIQESVDENPEPCRDEGPVGSRREVGDCRLCDLCYRPGCLRCCPRSSLTGGTSDRCTLPDMKNCYCVCAAFPPDCTLPPFISFLGRYNCTHHVCDFSLFFVRISFLVASAVPFADIRYHGRSFHIPCSRDHPLSSVLPSFVPLARAFFLYLFVPLGVPAVLVCV